MVGVGVGVRVRVWVRINVRVGCYPPLRVHVLHVFQAAVYVSCVSTTYMCIGASM